MVLQKRDSIPPKHTVPTILLEIIPIKILHCTHTIITLLTGRKIAKIREVFADPPLLKSALGRRREAHTKALPRAPSFSMEAHKSESH